VTNRAAALNDSKQKAGGSFEFIVTDDLINGFAELCGDKSSLHTDAMFARRSMYRKKVAHGMIPLMGLSFLSFGNKKQQRLKKISARFMKPAFSGDRLGVSAKRSENPTETEGLVSYEFNVKNLTTGTTLTFGHMTLEDSLSGGPSENLAPRGEKKTAPLILGPLTEADLAFDKIQKGDKNSFDFCLLDSHAQTLYSLLVKASGPGAPEFLTWKERVDPAPFLSLSLFSTFVGMCIPGRHATFMDLGCDFFKTPYFGETYELEGAVDFKSGSTSTISEVLTIRSKPKGRETIAMGKLNAKVNEPPAKMPSVEFLKENALELGLKGKVILITGASRGIGETTAKLFSAHGAKVAVNYFQGSLEANAIVDEILKNKGQAFAVRADVSDRAQVRSMVEAVVKKYSRLDVLVNNAVGDAYPVSFQELQWEQVQKDLDIVVKGAFYCCQEALPHMAKNGGGRIINLSTVFTETPPPLQTKYVIAKSALVGLTRSLAVELAASNITVNLVVSSLVETDLSKHVPKMFLERMKNETPMKRHASPEDVAKAVVYLASSLASFTTGQKIMITGGNAPFL